MARPAVGYDRYVNPARERNLLEAWLHGWAMICVLIARLARTP